MLKSSAKSKIRKALIAKLGSKFIPIIGLASWALVGYTSVQSVRGYNYTKVYAKYETWTYYKMQGGKWVRGYCYKHSKLEFELVK